MPYRKRTYRRKRPVTRKRTYRPRSKWSKRPRKQGIYYFKRHVALTNITIVNGTSNTYGVYTFSLDQLPNFGEFTALYDAFKINRIKINFIPTSNVSISPSTTANDVFKSTQFDNRLFTVLDFNDSTVPTSVDELRQYQTCKWSPNNRIHKRYFKPKVQGTVTLGNFQTSPWLQSASSSDVEYYGLKYALTHQTLSVSNEVYKVEAIYYCSFKQVK